MVQWTSNKNKDQLGFLKLPTRMHAVMWAQAVQITEALPSMIAPVVKVFHADMRVMGGLGTYHP